MAIALANIKTAVNKLFEANKEKGWNTSKKTFITDAKTELKTAIDMVADGGANTPLSAGQKALAVESLNETVFALESAAGSLNGSGEKVLNQKIGAEYFHTENAYTKAVAAMNAA
jgi:hypothetical protein